MRESICDFLITNPKLSDDLPAEQAIKFETDDEVTLEDYVKRMRMESTMGGAIEIKAYCILYKKNVQVLNAQDKRSIDFIEDPSYEWVNLLWMNKNHYEPIRVGRVTNDTTSDLC